MGLLHRAALPVSRVLAAHPRWLFAAQQKWLGVGNRLLDLQWAAWAIGRPEWLMQKSKREPTSVEPPLSVGLNERDRLLAARIIASVRKAGGDTGKDDVLIPPETMWGILRQRHYARLRGLVEAGDVAALAGFLSRLFRTETVDGFAYGTWFDSLPHRWAYLPVNIELSVITLAEYLAILRPEQHEQGNFAYWRLEWTEEALIEQLEAFFGFRIEAPRAGDPRGIMFGGRFLTRETCAHLYSAHRMREAIVRKGLAGPLDIVEIGGGYGGTCYWLRKILGDRIRRYVIVDLPEVALVQAYFLGSAAPQALVLGGEDRVSVSSPIELLPHFRLNEIDFRPNVVINQDSMPEMPLAEVERYLSWASERLDGLFLSFNHEAYSPVGGVPQIHLPPIFVRFPRFRRLSRETSWSRRGYVEEVYETV